MVIDESKGMWSKGLCNSNTTHDRKQYKQTSSIQNMIIFVM